MAYEEQESKRSRVVVETPTARREVVETQAVRTPDRGGISAGTVGVIVVLAVALVTILVLLLMSGQTTETNDLASQQAQQPAPVPQTTIVQQPAPVQQQPIVVQQPVPVPVIVTPPPSTARRGANDTEIEAAIQKKFSDDTALSALAVTVTVIDGEVTLLGTVKSEAEKTLAQRAVEAIRGVKNVDNQITVIP